MLVYVHILSFDGLVHISIGLHGRHSLLLRSDFKLVLIAAPDQKQEERLTTLKASADPAQAIRLSLPSSAT